MLAGLGQAMLPQGTQGMGQALQAASPLLLAMSQGLQSGQGAMTYAPQGIAAMMAMKEKSDEKKKQEEAARLTSGLFGQMMGGSTMGPAPSSPRQGGMFPGQPPAGNPSVGQGNQQFGDLGQVFSETEQRFGLPPGFLSRTAQIESGGDPNARNPRSSAAGLFQFIDSTAEQYGLRNKFDPMESTIAAARLARDNAQRLRQVLGRDPTAGELYLAHQQGAGGAAKLLSNPNARAVDVVGEQAVRLNGGDPNMTAGQFAGLWTGKFGGGQQSQQQQPRIDPQRAMAILQHPDIDPSIKQMVAGMMQGPEQQEPTALMRNAEWLMGQGMSREEAIAAARGGTNVNVNTGDAPRPELLGTQGLVAVPDPTSPQGWRVEPAPGSPIAVEREQAEEQAQKAGEVEAEQAQSRANVVGQTIDNIRSMLDQGGPLDLPEVGIIGSRLTGINQESADMAGMLDTLKGMVVFDRLEALREASATGASGLGQVTEREIALLGAQLGALDQSLSKDRLKQTLDTIEDVFGKLSPQAQEFLTGQTDDLREEVNNRGLSISVRRYKYNPETGELE